MAIAKRLLILVILACGTKAYTLEPSVSDKYCDFLSSIADAARTQQAEQALKPLYLSEYIAEYCKPDHEFSSGSAIAAENKRRYASQFNPKGHAYADQMDKTETEK